MCPSCAGRGTSPCAGTSPTATSSKGHPHKGAAADATGGLRGVDARRTTRCSSLFRTRVSDGRAVFADPSPVSLHSITRHPPPPGRQGAGLWRGLARAVPRSRSSTVSIPTSSTRWMVQVRRAGAAGHQARRPQGAGPRGRASPSSRTGRVVRRRAAQAPWAACPWPTPAGIDVVYDTIGKPRPSRSASGPAQGPGHAREKRRPHDSARWE